MLVKSTKRAKSTVAPGELISEAVVLLLVDDPRVAEVMVTENDSTSQMGASVPNATTEPDCAGAFVSEFEDPPFVPHPTISKAAKITAPPENIILLLILSS
jgi:hypothetical protein